MNAKENFEIEIRLADAKRMANATITQMNEWLYKKRASLIAELVDRLLNSTTGILWWKELRYEGFHRTTIVNDLAVDLIDNGKVPYEDFWYDDGLHIDRMELIDGYEVLCKRFAQNILDIDDNICSTVPATIRLNAKAYKMINYK